MVLLAPINASIQSLDATKSTSGFGMSRDSIPSSSNTVCVKAFCEKVNQLAKLIKTYEYFPNILCYVPYLPELIKPKICTELPCWFVLFITNWNYECVIYKYLSLLCNYFSNTQLR